MSGSYLPPEHLDVPSQLIKILLSTTFTLSGGISYQAGSYPIRIADETLCVCVKFIGLRLEWLSHWSQTQFLEGHSSAQFSSSPNQTHLIQIIKVFGITRNFQEGAIWSWLELNSAELRPAELSLRPMA